MRAESKFPSRSATSASARMRDRAARQPPKRRLNPDRRRVTLRRRHQTGTGKGQMAVITTALDKRLETFRGNDAAMRALVAELRQRSDRVREGGDQAARERHLARGKLLPRERIAALLDP